MPLGGGQSSNAADRYSQDADPKQAEGGGFWHSDERHRVVIGAAFPAENLPWIRRRENGERVDGCDCHIPETALSTSTSRWP